MMRHQKRTLSVELYIQGGFSAYVVAVVVFGWRQPALTSLLLATGVVVQLLAWPQKAQAVMMIAAAVLGTPAEIVCVKKGIWTYYAPGLLFGIPVWIPLIWAYLFGLFRRLALLSHRALNRVFSGTMDRHHTLLYRGLGSTIFLYAAVTISLVKPPIALTYAVFLLPAILFWRKERDILIFIIGGFQGTLGEYICMQLGFWRYHFPLLKSIGLPLSLPLAWGLSAIIIGRIAQNWET